MFNPEAGARPGRALLFPAVVVWCMPLTLPGIRGYDLSLDFAQWRSPVTMDVHGPAAPPAPAYASPVLIP
ncbi:hypothetical protein [Acidithiobacillus sp.]|uniref:hypothetical protein n=1 Tax=Acidithiobacillus sp. TaxID=1872118 RepID=UPI00262D5FAF|nr:hypothetical protein [Acidithiobacillus sp.]